jgi:hypothetical protein
MLCADCMKRARAKNGRPVEFSNQDLSGGLVGRYADTHEAYPGVDCALDGIPCRAEEGRFGGVIIQVLEST